MKGVIWLCVINMTTTMTKRKNAAAIRRENTGTMTTAAIRRENTGMMTTTIRRKNAATTTNDSNLLNKKCLDPVLDRGIFWLR